MQGDGVSFSIAAHAAWAPGVDDPQAWARWADAPFRFSSEEEPGARAIPPMLRRRAGFLDKMALEVACRCIEGESAIPVIFCSRHGEVARAVALLDDLVKDAPLSPTTFSLAVHNAAAGLFSIARGDRANHIALSAGADSVEHGVIEACGLLADGAEKVLLVSYDDRLPAIFAPYADGDEQPHAWAWLMVPSGDQALHLGWEMSPQAEPQTLSRNLQTLSPSLQVLRFQLRSDALLVRAAGKRRWRWTRHA